MNNYTNIKGMSKRTVHLDPAKRKNNVVEYLSVYLNPLTLKLLSTETQTSRAIRCARQPLAFALASVRPTLNHL